MQTVILPHKMPLPSRVRLATVVGLALTVVSSLPVSAVERHVYLINNSDRVALTGFRIRGGERGIVTCLHGVAFVDPEADLSEEVR